MKRLILKSQSLAVLAIALATLSSVLTACSTPNQNAAQSGSSSPTATNAGNQQMDHSQMNHGQMNHGMTMGLGPADAEFDLRFIDTMTPHHQGAIEMAKAAKQKSKRPEIQQLADDIIKSQNQEIVEMKQWRQAWYPQASPESIAYDSQKGQTMPMSPDQRKGMMMNVDLGAADQQFDLRFINAMIPHHESAVTMAKEALSKSKRPEIQQLAQAVITAQQTEINQMKQWRQAWYKS